MLDFDTTPFNCYLDKSTYGKFDLFYSRWSLLSVTYDTYVIYNNLC